MKIKLLLTTFLIGACSIQAQELNQSSWLWSAKAENGMILEQLPLGFIDQNNNHFVVGNFRGETTTIQGTTLQNTSAPPVNNAIVGDTYIAKFDSNGALLNVLHFSGSKYEQITSIAYDGNNHYFISGSFSGDIHIGNNTFESTTANASKVFLAKVTLDGNVVWAKEYPLYMGAVYLKYKNNNLYMAANYAYDQFPFDGLTLPVAGYNPTIPDMDKNMVAKLDPVNGNQIWTSSSRYTGVYTSVSSDRIGAQMRSMTVDNSGNVYVTGDFFSRSVTFGNVTLNRTSNTNGNVFYVKYDNTGAVVWAKTATIGASSDAKMFDVEVDSENSVYLVGAVYNSTINFGGGTTLSFPGNYGAFMVKYNAAGNLVWAKKGGIATDQAPSTSLGSSWFKRLYIDAQDNIFVGGSFYRILNMSPDFTYDLGPNFYSFLAKYNKSGAVQACEIYQSAANGIGPMEVLNSDPNNFTILGTTSADLQLNNLTIETNQKQLVYIAKTGDSALGLAEFGTANFAAYPNPANDRLFIKNKEQLSDNALFTVYDLNGRQIFRLKGADIGEKGIEVSKLAAGIYVLGVEDAQKQIKEYQKFVKNN
ncbi:T9SS type A sorting domain-containing protein [Flavobacterium cerinum]|uniref:T9SS type A sorting domain-containing protein n=1 Tax=Flavobacterium cerinum TaxID=2502784 RepID=A0ABY5IU06_9FLAO|nr:T9SS type A sorting domain-containing protein [Flavobacterium cerinum]UUC46139.1 T9SS type A sorting domain-containing protein [Flavobacterium cerinum]